MRDTTARVLGRIVGTVLALFSAAHNRIFRLTNAPAYRDAKGRTHYPSRVRAGTVYRMLDGAVYVKAPNSMGGGLVKVPAVIGAYLWRTNRINRAYRVALVASWIALILVYLAGGVS